MSLLALSLIHLVAVASPGPGFAVLFRHTINFSFKNGIVTAIGIAFGDLCLILISVFGADLLISKNPQVLKWIQIFGAAYLTYIGYQGLKNFFKYISNKPKDDVPNAEVDFSSYKKSFLHGFFTTLGNPKAIIYFISISSQVMRPGQTTMDLTILIFTLICITAAWFSTVALIVGNKKVRPHFMKYRFYIDGVMGLVLVLFGICFLMQK